MIGMLLTIIVSCIVAILVSSWMLENPATANKLVNGMFRVVSKLFKGKKKND